MIHSKYPQAGHLGPLNCYSLALSRILEASFFPLGCSEQEVRATQMYAEAARCNFLLSQQTPWHLHNPTSFFFFFFPSAASERRTAPLPAVHHSNASCQQLPPFSLKSENSGSERMLCAFAGVGRFRSVPFLSRVAWSQLAGLRDSRT